MCRIDAQIFERRVHFLIQRNVLAAYFTGGFARNWPLAHAKFASPWQPVAYKLCPSGHQSHMNCTWVAASRMQIVPAWLPVACNMNKINRNLHATVASSRTHSPTFPTRKRGYEAIWVWSYTTFILSRSWSWQNLRVETYRVRTNINNNHETQNT
jgi:hypothetical protein